MHVCLFEDGRTPVVQRSSILLGEKPLGPSLEEFTLEKRNYTGYNRIRYTGFNVDIF